MPPIIGLVLIGAGAIAGYKALRRAAERMTAELKRTEDEARRQRHDAPAGALEKDLGALEFDPASGVYRPRQH